SAMENNFSAAPGQKTPLTLQLTADADAPDNAIVVYTMTSAEGASATFTGNITLLPAVPVVSVVQPANGYVEVSVDRGELLSRQVTIVNKGLKDLKGVSIVPPTNVTWMSINLPASSDGTIPLPDLPVGGTNSFTVVFTPPSDVDLGFFQDKLTIQGTNAQSGFDVNLYARVTSSRAGSVQFYVDDILGLDVPNATIRLRNTDLQVELPPVKTDINGLVTVTNLQEGDWSWQVSAPGYSANVGVVSVVPDQTVQTHTRLNKSLVTVNFTVTPVPFSDKYEINIEQTFETHVPIPVLVMTPAYQAFQDVKPGFTATFIATAKNEGLVQMKDLSITGQQTGQATLTPLITYVPVLGPQQSIEIPFVVTYSGTNAPSQQGLGDAIAGCVGFGNVDTLAGFIEGMAAFAKAYAQCPKDATAITLATSVAVTMQILRDAEEAAENLLSPVKLLGCILGNLIGPINLGIGIQVGINTAPPQQSTTAFEPGTQGCFSGDTQVLLADGSLKPINQVRAGDVVKSGLSRHEMATVAEVYERNDNTCREIRFALPGQADPDFVQTTDEHLFWEDGKGWLAAAELKIGDWLLNSSGQRVRVISNKRLPGSHKVYTLKLLGDTAFYANGLLVHDLCGAWMTGSVTRVQPARFQPDNNSETRGQEARATISTR
ncbi:MAG TPA: polymorphic toxin-type HINT domain-containing protein, partial [Verrucomicrobiae bacterium]|nr:polymorphic toxin-type HINT domain-containing protein [Verrucomicrobiae bacterium]